jgi:hypothetical protein
VHGFSKAEWKPTNLKYRSTIISPLNFRLVRSFKLGDGSKHILSFAFGDEHPLNRLKKKPLSTVMALRIDLIGVSVPMNKYDRQWRCSSQIQRMKHG